VNPYEKTSEEMKRQSEGPKRFTKAAGSLAGTVAGAAAFAPMLARAAPFLSKYIPENLAVKGLSSISPAFGKFVSDGLERGYSFDQVKDFIGNQVSESVKSTAKDEKNLIQKESPELHQFIDEQIKKGRKPMEAGALAGLMGFQKTIDKLIKEHKTPWSSIVESIYGGQPQSQQQAQQPQQMQQPQQSAQGGSGQQALADILNKINQRLGA